MSASLHAITTSLVLHGQPLPHDARVAITLPLPCLTVCPGNNADPAAAVRDGDGLGAWLGGASVGVGFGFDVSTVGVGVGADGDVAGGSDVVSFGVIGSLGLC
ncbi:hypothetical protein BJY54_000347 [Streptomyces nodosus]|uniref:Uncharacterized protein n=1 Tax=Streptomyces nodosus TaxID=40318 RepID=A0A0B5DCG9_9ACTN|nr:hypothetical protein SNOD_01715 [Streptomyces nodosus]MBB4789735.1 hypothetical protein [Streptomyces nodosus]QEV37498.1 hypothetical protein CP978_02090 [Streptomyces nodosus]